MTMANGAPTAARHVLLARRAPPAFSRRRATLFVLKTGTTPLAGSRPQALRLAARHYTDMTESQMREALNTCAPRLVGVGQLAARLPDAIFPQPRPFGFHLQRSYPGGPAEEVPEVLQGCTHDARADVLAIGPDDRTERHCEYAIRHELPWFPLLASLATSPSVMETLAATIQRCVLAEHRAPEALRRSSRRWWFAYEFVSGHRLELPDVLPGASGRTNFDELVPFLPPERFFVTVGKPSLRHGVLDNLLGNRHFCPFVEKFAGGVDASANFKAELQDVLSPICMMTVKDFLRDAGLSPGERVDAERLSALNQQLEGANFSMTPAERAELGAAFGHDHLNTAGAREEVENETVITASRLVEFSQWLRGDSRLAGRLREHLLGVTPTDLRWHAPGEVFLDRLSRVISTVETRASQMIEGDLPPNKKERFFVDVISQPWERDDVVIDNALVYRLQQGLLSNERFVKVCETQADGEPRRTTQNWISSERHDDMVGKETVLHYLPPPPETLPDLYSGYFACVQRMLADPELDPIVCATVAKIAFNTLHPMADGNGRVQRMLFQLILFKFRFLPRVNIPVSVIMLRDRTGYEVLQQGHVDQIMAGLTHRQVTLPGDEEASFQHIASVEEGLLAAYRFQDFTFATSCMIKLMQQTLPVIAAKAYFLRRFDWRVDELLKDDALLPPRAATKIAKAFKNDPSSHGFSYAKLFRLLFLDGWWIGLRRIRHFLRIAKHPDDLFGLKRLRHSLVTGFDRSNRRLWLTSSGQIASHLGIRDGDKLERGTARGRVIWVAVSLDNFSHSESALKQALHVAVAGDSVVALHYPMVTYELFTDGIYPELRYELLSEVAALRKRISEVTNDVVEKHRKDGVAFDALIGDAGAHAYKPASALCRDLRLAEAKPYRVYVGYDPNEPSQKFANFVAEHAPCDVVVSKTFTPSEVVRWVGISARNLLVSARALERAFEHSSPGDSVVAVHYPANPFLEEGLSSVFESHYSSVCDDNMDIIMDSMHERVLDTARRTAETHGKEGVHFQTFVGMETSKPHSALVADAARSRADVPRPHVIYVGYSPRRDRSRLVGPQKLHDVAEHIVQGSPCNVVLVKG
eukprot:TRINITY_DN25591_c0_g1_i1.p2 TRINITY_DN25591_c0_g1~~TRINITY_DN25591_c0_g1_i1.p2  ORF type:complete len:1096 (-),score=225.79 TRINITY_DN25591_c0_g1_i1:69-3356(-)